MTAKTLIIGVGNEFRGDDAVGLLVARRLAGMALPGVTIMEQSGEGADLMAAWKGADTVFIVDAAQSGAEPGKIHRFDVQDKPLPTDFFSFSSHAFGVVEAIELSRILGELPKRVVVYGIEGGDFETGMGLSPAVERAIETVIQRLLDEIRREFDG